MPYVCRKYWAKSFVKRGSDKLGLQKSDALTEDLEVYPTQGACCRRGLGAFADGCSPQGKE